MLFSRSGETWKLVPGTARLSAHSVLRPGKRVPRGCRRSWIRHQHFGQQFSGEETMGRMFGTDGVRGIANVHPMTAEMALEIGRATAYVCKKHPKQRHTIAIGKDTRVSGYMLESALTAGICSMGVDVLLVGPMSTPGIAFITHSMRAD